MNGRDAHDCVIYGGFAGGTVGDEIALGVALRDVREHFGSNVAVLSRAPEETARLFPGTEVIRYEPKRRPERDRSGLLTLLRRSGGRDEAPDFEPRHQTDDRGEALPWVSAVRNARHIYLAGGGYLNDVWHLYFTLLPVWVAADAGVPISTAPIQVGPFFSRTTARRAARVLAKASVVVRDQTSLEVCRQIGLSATEGIDDVFRVAEVVPGLDRGGRGRRRVGICIFRQNGANEDEFDAWWTAFLRPLANRKDIVVEGFQFHLYPGWDYSHTRDLFARADLTAAVLAPPQEFRTAVRRLLDFDAVVSCRFHAALLASALGMPAMAFAAGEYYEAKLSAFWPGDVRPLVPLRPSTVSPQAAVQALMEMLER